ncbi:SGNH/GDSL hydrolase family protein [Streptomyces sp. NPDC058045]|uniref:SGNH/GDSL hydrolase family protein n=1 Tax=Streptomyces sp. NPDC058045 TaxID=3346311 RepID=UPI0036ED741A
MTERHDGDTGVSTARYGALLAAVVAAVVAVSTGIYLVAAGSPDRTQDNALAGPRNPHNSAAPASAGTWVGSWSASPTGAEPGTEPRGYAGSTVRNVVHSSVGGTGARITLSNLYGQSPLTISHASVAVATGHNNPSAQPGTLRSLTFDGATSVVIAAGQQVMSDAVRLRVPHDADLLVSSYSPTPSGPVTYHLHARQISYLAQGDRTTDTTGGAYSERSSYWRYVTALDVLSNESEGTVVVIGDSLTDGITSTMGADRRWTDLLAQRMREESGAPRYGVVNQGISGNQILTDGPGRPPGNPSGLSRFRRDVLDRTGVRTVVVVLGINDILRNPQADAGKITGGLREMTRQAHARGLRVVGATLMPFAGHPGYSRYLEGVRQSVNGQLRGGKVFDAVIDFDRSLRDPYNPRKLRPDFDSGDHLHPSDRGFRRMADAVDLTSLKGATSAEL